MKPDRAIRRAMKRRAQNELSGAISGAGPTFPQKLFSRMQDVAGSFLDEDDPQKKAMLRGTLNGMAFMLHHYYAFFKITHKVKTVGYYEKKAVQLAQKKREINV